MVMWIKPSRAVNTQYESSLCPGNVTVPMANSNQNWAFEPTEGGGNLGVGLSIGTNGVYVASHATNLLTCHLKKEMEINDFVCVGLVFRSDSALLYVNGTLVSSRWRYCQSSSLVIAKTVKLGGALYAPQFSGIIDDFGLWERPLSKSEITAIYNQKLCSDVVLNDTTKFEVASAEFEFLSPDLIYKSTDSLQTSSGGCDSIVNNYVEYFYDSSPCTEIIYDTITIGNSICQTIGNDSAKLHASGYIVGPQLKGNQPINTDSKWIDVKGADSLYVNTMQHRFYDKSKIYDENNNLIWNWDGESVPAITWYSKYHSIFIGDNDSVRIEFYQGYPNFSVGHLQITGMSCGYNNLEYIDTIEVIVHDTTYVIDNSICQTIGNDSAQLQASGYIVGPQNLDCGKNVHTESKWINTLGIDTIIMYTMQHRLFDASRIYDRTDQLIWEWKGENASATWYEKQHSLNIEGNDSIKLEFYQGYNDPFCNGYLKVSGIICSDNYGQILYDTITVYRDSIIQIYQNVYDTTTTVLYHIDTTEIAVMDTNYINVNNYIDVYDTTTTVLYHIDTTQITVTDTNYINVNNYVDVYDSLIVDLTGAITSVNAPFNNTLQVKVYPNPASEVLILEVLDAEVTASYTYELINVNGQTVLANGSLSSNTNTVDIASYSGGTYYVKFYDAQQKMVNQAPVVIRK
jgi:hypothetical protein